MIKAGDLGWLKCKGCKDNFVIFFFFSSRRRHTRCSRDWSSDVCSSDLASPAPPPPGARWWRRGRRSTVTPAAISTAESRSEERRVGKEGRSLWSPYYLKNNHSNNT